MTLASFYRKFKKIVQDFDTPAGRIFDLVVQAFILISIVGFCIETLPDLNPTFREFLNVLETGCVILFTVEYLLRILVADKKLYFIFSFFGIVDLVAILPFYLASGIDLRSLRIMRLVRVIRLFKLFRYTKAMNRLKNAFLSVREELGLFFIASFILLFISSVGIFYFEHEVQPEKFTSIFHCMWWSVITMTTVGYGDVYPITVGGKVFTSAILFMGLGIVAVPTGLIASALTKTVIKKQKKEPDAR